MVNFFHSSRTSSPAAAAPTSLEPAAAAETGPHICPLPGRGIVPPLFLRFNALQKTSPNSLRIFSIPGSNLVPAQYPKGGRGTLPCPVLEPASHYLVKSSMHSIFHITQLATRQFWIAHRNCSSPNSPGTQVPASKRNPAEAGFFQPALDGFRYEPGDLRVPR